MGFKVSDFKFLDWQMPERPLPLAGTVLKIKKCND